MARFSNRRPNFGCRGRDAHRTSRSARRRGRMCGASFASQSGSSSVSTVSHASRQPVRSKTPSISAQSRERSANALSTTRSSAEQVFRRTSSRIRHPASGRKTGFHPPAGTDPACLILAKIACCSTSPELVLGGRASVASNAPFRDSIRSATLTLRRSRRRRSSSRSEALRHASTKARSSMSESWAISVRSLCPRQTGAQSRGIVRCLTGTQPSKFPRLTSPRDRAVLEHLLEYCGSPEPENVVDDADVEPKYGPGGEGELHRRLKEYVAQHPEVLGLGAGRGSLKHPFVTGDRVDVLVEIERWRQLLAMLAGGFATRRGRRSAYLHRDVVNGELRARRRRCARRRGVRSGRFDRLRLRCLSGRGGGRLCCHCIVRTG